MYGKSDDICAPVSSFSKITLVPLTVTDQLYRIRKAEASEYDFITLRVDELVAFNLHPAFLSWFCATS